MQFSLNPDKDSKLSVLTMTIILTSRQTIRHRMPINQNHSKRFLSKTSINPFLAFCFLSQRNYSNLLGKLDLFFPFVNFPLHIQQYKKESALKNGV